MHLAPKVARAVTEVLDHELRQADLQQAAVQGPPAEAPGTGRPTDTRLQGGVAGASVSPVRSQGRSYSTQLGPRVKRP